MALICIIPIALKDTANAALEAAGFGPGCFNIELMANPNAQVTHIGFHSWREDLEASVSAMSIPAAIIEKRPGFIPQYSGVFSANNMTIKMAE